MNAPAGKETLVVPPSRGKPLAAARTPPELKPNAVNNEQYEPYDGKYGGGSSSVEQLLGQEGDEQEYRDST